MSFRFGILHETGHRPWPLPDGRWVMTQTWHDLLFAHWPVAAGVLREKVPPELALDLHHGQAWIGVVPFRMSNVGARALPPVPTASTFLELNVRTYVRVRDKPGVYFFSLDAASRLAVAAARMLFQLPYFHADMHLDVTGQEVRYESRRRARGPSARFVARYAPSGQAYQPEPGSLVYFLTERYCLYTVRNRLVRRVDIHHPRWMLNDAQGGFDTNTMAEACGIQLSSTPPLLHFAERQDAVAWWPVRV